MGVPFVGQSYQLRSRTADLQRTVNMIPLPLEPGNERSVWRFKDIPGLVAEYDIGGGAVRGGLNNNGRVFVVIGSSLLELQSDGTSMVRGSLGTSAGNVGMVANTTQLVFSDGLSLYVLALATNVLTSTPFLGKARIDYINQYIVFITRGTQQFAWTALGDAS